MTLSLFAIIFGLIYLSEATQITPEMETILLEMCPGYQSCSHGNASGALQPSSALVTTETEDNNKNMCCFPCSCDRTTCEPRHNCCPSVLQTAIPTEQPTMPVSDVTSVITSSRTDGNGAQRNTLTETVCVPTSINIDRKFTKVNETKNWSVHHLNFGVFMTSQCPPEVNESRCTNPDPNNIMENIPQTDSNGTTYRNIYCAHCNSVTDLSAWRVYVSCSNINIYKADDMLFPNTIEKMYRFAVSADEPTCGVDFMPPEKVNMTSTICLADENVISECNDTSANQSVIEACRSLNMPFVNSEEDGVTVYANVFCYMCTLKTVTQPKCPQSIGLSYYNNNTFVAELNLKGENETSFLSPWQQDDMTPARYVPGHVDCVNNTVFDPYTRECREWFCPLGRMISGTDCIPILKKIDKVTYRVDLRLEPDGLSKDNFNATNKTDVALATIDAILGNSVEIEKELVILSQEMDVPYLYTMFLLKVVYPSDRIRSLVDQTTFENEVVINGINGPIAMKVSFSTAIKLELSSFLFADVIVIDMLRYSALRNLFRVNMNTVEVAIRYPKISRLSFCTQILLTKDEINYYVDIIDVRGSGLRLYEGEFLRTVQYEDVRVCLSDYLRNVHEDMKPKPKESYSPQAILSVVCNIMSIVGLVITIITYVIFDELRSVPGKNNMMLSLHLLIAQCLYQFGMDKTEYPNACVVLGMLVHLFWLTAIFWMNACTLHMFRTFVTGQSYRSLRAFDPQVCGYACYCYGVAVLMVGINVGISLYESDGKDFGYGGRICYISKPMMVGWTFALPVGVIIILNMSFFFAVVYQISSSTMRRRGKQTDRANTVIYMKLSSLTGVTWIFGYLYLWTDFAPLEYIFIVLNAGQGVFIFISFICTKRIVKLYRGLFRKWGRSIRDTGICACARKPIESETNGVDVNTAKVSLTAGSSSKGVLPAAIAKKIMRFPSSHGVTNAKKNNAKISVNGVCNKSSDNSTSDVFKESAAIAHALSQNGNPGSADHERKHSRRTESESLSDHDGSEIDMKSFTSVICHTNVELLPTVP